MDIIELLEQATSHMPYKIHILCKKEIIELIHGESFEPIAVKQLYHKLILLSTLGVDATKSDNFEKLREAPGLCRIKLKSRQFNIRVIYSIKGRNIFLLLAFWEKGGKKSTDYSTMIPAATNRLIQIYEN